MSAIALHTQSSNSSESSDSLIGTVEALMRASGIGVRRYRYCEAYLHALEAVLQCTKVHGRRDLFAASLHAADNLILLRDHPELRVKAMLPLLDFPIALHDCVEQAADPASADVLLACLTDPGWPQPLSARRTQHLRALFALPADPDRDAAVPRWPLGAPDAQDSAFIDMPPMPDGFDDAQRLWQRAHGPILDLVAAADEPDAAHADHAISERERAEATRRSLEVQLQQSQKMEAIGTLAGGIANDFNNILGAILGHLALACEELDATHAARQHLEQINKSARRARTLAGEILTFSRQDKQDMADQPLQPLVHEALTLVRSSLPAGVEIQTDLESQALHVMADASKVQQALVQLCSNALEALRGREGRIEVGLEGLKLELGSAQRPASLAPGAYAHLWIRDDGCGMDDATRRRVFEPFFTTKSRRGGTGIGLSVVHGIVASHHGAIVVDSFPGEGSTFHLYLPLSRGRGGVRTPELSVVASAPRDNSSRHVLYLDDDEVMLNLAQTLLRRQGYRVTCFEDPKRALEAVRAAPRSFDLVVTDINMEVLDGFGVVRELARIRPDLPVVVSSGNLSDDRRAEMLSCGVRALIHKENTFEELRPAVDRLLTAVAKAAR